MSDFYHPQAPVYTQDHMTYCRQMVEWHMKMVTYQEQLKAYHLERAKHFQKLLGSNVTPLERPKDGVA